MNIQITPSTLKGKVQVPVSKSILQRLLIAASLADKPSVIPNLEESSISEDIKDTISILKKLGAGFIYDKHHTLTILPIQEMPCTKNIHCGSSATALRILIPVAAALGMNGYTFTGSQQLSARPLKPLLKALEQHGILVNGESLPVRISGQLHGGIYRISGDETSQYLSGLLFALPLLISDSKIIVTTDLVSSPYINLTLDILKQFGISIKRQGNNFIIPQRQDYKTPGVLKPEGDWSSAAFWLAAGATGDDEITVCGLNTNSVQGDKSVLDIINKMSGHEDILPLEGISVNVNKLHGTVIDCKDTPDLVPALAVLACVADGTTIITNVNHLKNKETDRLTALYQNLTALGADISQKQSELIIRGGKPLYGGIVKGFNDHRIVMAMAILSRICTGPLTITDAESIKKSYPDFIDDFRRLGGIVDVL